ncbi:hypothetical protein [Actinacidiphila soli]|uniref:hypothetical protein n=1 Tax=Actinacidiphila soli TaxID=2487275 RepID=UPI0013E35EDA|nr:hypothetical protein [Actinacidiphila soli]
MHPPEDPAQPIRQLDVESTVGEQLGRRARVRQAVIHQQRLLAVRAVEADRGNCLLRMGAQDVLESQ